MHIFVKNRDACHITLSGPDHIHVLVDNKQHELPHIHVKYSGEDAVYSIPHGTLLEGSLPSAKERLILAWIELRKEDLMADWQLAVNGQNVFKIDPLK